MGNTAISMNADSKICTYQCFNVSKDVSLIPSKTSLRLGMKL